MAQGRKVAAARLEAVLIIQKKWREARARRVSSISDALRCATLDLVAALTEFSAATRAELRVDRAEQKKLEAVRTIQHAWRTHYSNQKATQYLMEVFKTARARVLLLEVVAREEGAARVIQAAWRDRSVLQRVSSYLMDVYQTAQEVCRLNETYGSAVITIQTHVRAYLVRTQHRRAAACAAIRDRLMAATDRADVLRREGINDPTTLGNMTRVALDALQRGNDLPSVMILQDLARCLASSCACCEQFINDSGIQHLTRSLIQTSMDRMREDSTEQALACIEALAACGRFSDRAGGILLRIDHGEQLKRLFDLLFELKGIHELFHALVGALSALGKGSSFCQAISSSDDLSNSLRGVYRVISVKQLQVTSYLENLHGNRGSSVSFSNATRALYRIEQQTAALARLMAVFGLEEQEEEETEGQENPSTGNRDSQNVSTDWKPQKAMTTPSGPHKTPMRRRVLGNISNNTTTC